MTDSPAPTYRYRGNVAPSAEVSRPVAVRRNAATTDSDQKTATSATLDIFDVIDSWGGWWGISARDVDAALAKVPDVDTLYVRVNSPGGEATEGVAIANLLRAHPANVHVTVMGLAASAASYIATAGDDVSMAPGSMLMIHDAWNIALGSADDLRVEAGVLDTLSDSIASLYAMKAGGTADDWRAKMRAETWYTAAQAVDSGLADQVGIGTVPAPVVDEDEALAEELAELVEAITANDAAQTAAMAMRAAARFDLSMFTHAPAAFATHCRCGSNGSDVSADPRMEHKNECPTRNQTPAEQPVAPSTDPKEADTMSDTLLNGLRQQLGLSDDADEATVLAANAEALAEAADPAPAASADPAPIPEGKVVVSQNVLDELKAMAQAGVQARSKQLAEERDEAIQAAFSAGKISAERKDAWKASWDKDPEGTKADLDSLPARFPVAALAGTPGHDGDSVKEAPFTEDEGDALAALAGLPKGALR